MAHAKEWHRENALVTRIFALNGRSGYHGLNALKRVAAELVPEQGLAKAEKHALAKAQRKEPVS